jgi:hypothetical protein
LSELTTVNSNPECKEHQSIHIVEGESSKDITERCGDKDERDDEG